jgi:hypothetical protein
MTERFGQALLSSRPAITGSSVSRTMTTQNPRLARLWEPAPARFSPSIVRRRDRAYLIGEPAAGAAVACPEVFMPDTVSAATPSFFRPLVLIAAAAGVLLAATLVLWARYGTAVFYEMIVAGLAACL